MFLPFHHRKYLVITCLLSGFCHSVYEIFALLWCYTTQISSYWCYSTIVSPNSNGQAVRASLSDLFLHMSKNLTSWSVKIRHILSEIFLFTYSNMLQDLCQKCHTVNSHLTCALISTESDSFLSKTDFFSPGSRVPAYFMVRLMPHLRNLITGLVKLMKS